MGDTNEHKLEINRLKILKLRYIREGMTGDYKQDCVTWEKTGEGQAAYDMAKAAVEKEIAAELAKMAAEEAEKKQKKEDYIWNYVTKKLKEAGSVYGKLTGTLTTLFCDVLDYLRTQALNETPEQKEQRLKKDREWLNRYLPDEDVLYFPPVVLDLTGSDQIDTLNVNEGVYFDYDGDGFAEATGWVSSDAGILVIDSNGNGVLDNGSELFGSLTPLPNGQLADDGFQALAALGQQSGWKDRCTGPGILAALGLGLFQQ